MIKDKKRILSFLLILSILLSCISTTSFAEGQTDEEEEEEQEESEYIEDVFLMKDAGGSNTTVSSNGVSQWNKNYLLDSNKNKLGKFSKTTDPLDSTNSVGFMAFKYGEGAGNGSYKKSVGLTLGTNYVFSSDMMIPDGTGTQKADKNYTILWAGKTLLYLEQIDSTYYKIKLDGVEVGKVAVGTWFHFAFQMNPITEDGKTVELTSLLQGSNLKNLSGEDIATIKNAPKQISISKLEIEVKMTFPDDKIAENIYGIFVDNTWIYTPGDFVENTATLPVYAGDAYLNVQLDGILTIQFQHPVDASTLGTFKLMDSNGNEYNDVAPNFNPGHPTIMTYDFKDYPLPAYTSFVVVFGDTLADEVGNLATSSQILFETKGVLNQKPLKAQTIVKTSDFVMPDIYNTGYRGELVPIEDKYPELVSSHYAITDSIAKKYNYEFSGFICDSGYIFTMKATQDVYFHDFCFTARSYYGFNNSSSARLTISHFEGIGSKSAFVTGANFTVTYGYIHDGGGDLLKANGSNIIIAHNYIRDGGTKNPGAHADGIQFSGNTTKVYNNIQIYSNRIDMPQLYYDHVANATIFIKPEKDTKGYSNIQIVGNWFNGGGHTVYFALGYTGPEANPYFIYTDNETGKGYAFSPLVGSYPTNEDGTPKLEDYDGLYQNNKISDLLNVGSIVLYEGSTRVYSVEDITSGSAKVLLNFANYTLTQRSYKIGFVLTNEDGEIVYSTNQNGTVSRYIPVSEYKTNLQETQIDNGDGTFKTVSKLSTLPELPQNVEVEVTLTDLPTDLTGCKLSVVVEDTTSNSTWIRSTVIDTAVHENTITELPKEEPKYYTVTFVANEETISTQSILKGEGATEPNNLPEVDGYRFKEWDTSFTNITSDTTITAIYEVIPQYTVTFVDDAGTLDTQTIYEGESATEPTPRDKAGYRFSSWDISFDNITEDITVNAVYEEITEFSVTFYDVDGVTVLKTEVVQKNASATPPVYVAATGYRFVEWDTAYNNVTSDLNVKVVLEAIPQYTVTFVDASGTVDTKTIYEGDGVVAPTPTTKEGYTFKSWDHTLDNITSDTTITAEYEMDKELFTSAIGQLENAQTLFSKKMAIRGVNTVLSYWTEEEIQTLDATQMATYTSAVSAYNLVVTNAQSDMATIKELLDTQIQ